MPIDTFSILKTSLLDLLLKLEDRQIPLILGGGYGLYLKQLHLQQSNSETLIDGELWPRPRATQDIDILLKTEVIADTEKMMLIKEALNNLGYEPVPGAEYMQFIKDLGDSRSVKVDFLTGPLDSFKDDPRLRVDDRRVKPPKSVGLHAHRTDEAVAFQDEPMELTVEGVLSNGHPYSGAIYIAQSFTYLLMKLFAFRDQRDDQEKNYARHHALDLYRIVAMLTKDEYDLVKKFVGHYQDNPEVAKAQRIIREDFNSPESTGSLRLQEHELFTPEMRLDKLDKFLEALNDLFH
jgi:hypothetical protein